MEHPFNAALQPGALPASLWAATAAPAAQTTPLGGDKTADVLIIGGGILGLSTALHLAALGQKQIMCLEAAEIGWGASGRNNGQVIPGLKYDPDSVKKRLDNDTADALIRCSGQAPDVVFNLIEKAGIACDAVRKGWIQPAPSAHAEKVITARMQQWQALSAPVEMLDKASLKERLGTAWYRAAWLDRRGGSVNPLAYTRGLAAASMQAGVSLFTQTPVTGYRQNSSGEWQVSTPYGSVIANQLVLASNAYIGQLNHSLCKTLVPVRTAQIASVPLADEYWQSILPQGEAASDASHLLTSFRITPDKRLVMGGAYATGGDESMALFNALKCAAQRRFPQLSAVSWPYQWSGYLAITPPHLPQIYQLAERCYAPIGCNGRGIAMSTMTGKQLAGLLTQGEPAACAIPVVQPQPRILYPLRHIGISTQVIWASIKDKFKV